MSPLHKFYHPVVDNFGSVSITIGEICDLNMLNVTLTSTLTEAVIFRICSPFNPICYNWWFSTFSLSTCLRPDQTERLILRIKPQPLSPCIISSTQNIIPSLIARDLKAPVNETAA